ncbi:hypothetical protein WG8_4307 [Paenibacillus sp. Aloe-11]|nr:hypothetical protein WG8_4307 [Paenibacillus sp. Aloe-11]
MQVPARPFKKSLLVMEVTD